MKPTVREALYRYCETYIQDRYARIERQIQSLQQALISETKSSAGDKHETGRAMIQLEREKLGNQLAEVELLQQRFKKVPLEGASDQVALGSLVFTSQYHYYIGISAGKVSVEDQTFFAIAPNTPMGKLLMGKSQGACINFNGSEFCITAIG